MVRFFNMVTTLLNLLLKTAVNSILQIILFVLVPFAWWFVTARKRESFGTWVGLKKAEGGKKTLVATAMASLVFLLLGALSLYMTRDVETATSEFAGFGVCAIPAIIVYATLNTALPEELLFRGFLLKRLANYFRFNIANIVQALLFGLLHGAMFFPLIGTMRSLLIIAFTSAIAWSMGYINENFSGGSIFPSWIIHAVSNLFAGICAAFSLI